MAYLYEGKTYYLYIDLNTPLQINSTTHNGIMIKHYCYDSKFCSNGKSTIEVVLADLEFDYWNGLKQSSFELYKNEKARIASVILAEIQRVYPEITGMIMMTDIASPVTFKRYCNAHKGSYMSFLTSLNVKQESHKGTIAGIQNMGLAGQWVFPDGGLPMAVIAGKFAALRICKQEKKSLKL